MNNFAPVFIPTLNRHEHFKRCVESLSKCAHAEKTDLFIFLDYPLKDSHWEGYEHTKAYLPGIKGFNKVTVIARERNYGAVDNFFKSVEYLFKRYDRLICSEDDNVFAPDFLFFVNKGLDVYKNREDIFSVSGYQYPIEMPGNYDKEVYLWQGFSAWGVGIWKDKWEKVDFQLPDALSNIRLFLKNYKDVYGFQKIANHYLSAMITMLEKNKVSGDGTVCLHQYVNSMYSVFPTISRVRNMGHDGSGTGCGIMEDDIFAKQELYSAAQDYNLPVAIKSDTYINHIMSRHFKIPAKSKIKIFAKLLLVNAGLWPKRLQ